METTDSFIKFLQSSISPIALISGIGLILLTLTNRLGRTTDRSRDIVKQLRERSTKKEKQRRVVQLNILYRRSKFLRISIVSISFSILTSTLIIPILLVMNLLTIDLSTIGIFIFMLSIFGIIIAAIFLFIDVMWSLKALQIGVNEYLD